MNSAKIASANRDAAVEIKERRVPRPIKTADVEYVVAIRSDQRHQALPVEPPPVPSQSTRYFATLYAVSCVVGKTEPPRAVSRARQRNKTI